MATTTGPSVVSDGLALVLDAKNPKSYPGTGNQWYDLSGKNNHFTIDSSNIFFQSDGTFLLDDDRTTGGISKLGSLGLQNTNSTCVFWLKTTDTQSLFWGSLNSNSYYLGAYRIGAKFYNGLSGNPSFHMDGVQRANIYDVIRDNQWHMLEFKDVQFSSWTNLTFSKYDTFSFSNSYVSYISVYDRVLTQEESIHNYNTMKIMFGL